MFDHAKAIDPRLAHLKARALATIHHLGTEVAILETQEKELQRQVEASLNELKEQVERFGRAIGKDEDLAYFILGGIKHFINSHLSVAMQHREFITRNDLPTKQKILIAAQVQMDMVTSLERKTQEEGAATVTDAIMIKMREEMSHKAAALKIEVSQLESRLAQIERHLEDKRRQMENPVQGEGPEGLRQTYAHLKIKIQWLEDSVNLLKFGNYILMPKRQRLSTLEEMLSHVLDIGVN